MIVFYGWIIVYYMDRSPFLDASTLAQTVFLIANDSVLNDDLRKTAIKMAKPPT